MTTEQKRKILQRIKTLETDIETLKAARVEIAKSGYASATLASAGGSKSFTRLDIGKITEAISQLNQELRENRKLLGGTTGTIKEVMWTRC